VNDAPVAMVDSFTVNEGSTTNLNLAANDSDADDGLDLTSIAIVSGPANGALVVNADGTVDYTHDGSETVADSFTYTINDLSGATSNTVTVNLTVTPVNDTPTGSVTIDNMAPAEGDTLTASNTLADADGLSGPIGYQWYLDGIAIGGATGATYTAVPADVGGVITVVASYTDDQGTFESVSSGATAAVTNVNYAPTGSVTISGTPTEDQTLTASNTLADVDGMGPVSYQWQRDGVDIGGATGSTYILGDADVGTTITVIAGYTDGDGTNESVSSAGVGPIANVNDVPITAPVTLASIAEDSGARLITQAELLVNAVDLDGDGLTATGLAIAGGNGSLVDNGDGSWTYTPAGNDDTSVSFSYTISDGTAGVAASATLDITPVNDAAVIDESPGPVDEGDGDPDPGDEGDPVATEPDEVLPIEEVLPPPEVMAIPNSRPLEMLDVTGAHWNRPRHFAATIALMKPEYVYRNDNGSPAVDVAFLNSFKREPASASEGNFVPAATVYFSPEVMAQALDHLQKQIDNTMELDVNQEQLIIGAATGLGASVMVGYVVWAFRGASLLLGALSAMPMWRC
ncbi:MAG: tandem-95 repeat protein, partial [Desulfobacterales bacterium]